MKVLKFSEKELFNGDFILDLPEGEFEVADEVIIDGDLLSFKAVSDDEVYNVGVVLDPSKEELLKLLGFEPNAFEVSVPDYVEDIPDLTAGEALSITWDTYLITPEGDTYFITPEE